MNKKIAIIIDHYPISPRAINTMNSLQKGGFEVEIFSWNRSSTNATEENKLKIFNQPIGYGKKIKKFMNLLKFKKFLKEEINIFGPDYIHSIDFEMLFLSFLLKKKNKNIKMIYEVYDIKFFANKYLNFFRSKIESLLIKKVDGIIFASPFFNKYYQTTKHNIVMNNKPLKPKNKITSYEENRLPGKSVNIGFVGTIRYYDMFKVILTEISRRENFEFSFYGSGPDTFKLKEFVENNNLTNIKFYGRFTSSELPSIYNDVDVIWACYPNSDTNVKYAVSNKYFESKYFNRLIIVSENTFLSDVVVSEKSGFGIDPLDKKNVCSLLDSLSLEFVSDYSYNKKSEKNSNNTWESQENLLIGFYKFY